MFWRMVCITLPLAHSQTFNGQVPLRGVNDTAEGTTTPSFPFSLTELAMRDEPSIRVVGSIACSRDATNKIRFHIDSRTVVMEVVDTR